MTRVSDHTALRCLIVAGTAAVVSRERVLSADESAHLESAVRRLTSRRDVWRWTAKENQLLKAFIRKRARIGRPRPFQPNDEVRRLAQEMGRSYMAVHRQIERLRKRMKCSNAKRGAKG
jgi:hypothetical protein